MKRYRTYIIIASIIALIGIIVAARYSTKKSNYIVEKVKKEDIIETIEVSGNVSAGSQAQLDVPINGVIEEVYVQNGDEVGATDALVSITSTATDQEKAKAYADYTQAVSSLKTSEQSKLTAQTQLEEARRQTISAQSSYEAMVNRQTNPDTKQAYTQLEKDAFNSAVTSANYNFKTAEKRFLDADSAITAARAQVNATWQTYKGYTDTVVRAPLSGTVTNLLKKRGDSVSIENPLLFIITTQGAHIDVQLNESDIGRVVLGDRAVVTFDALPDKKINGTVSVVSTVGTNSQGIVTYPAQIAINDSSLQPGLTSYVGIETGKVRDALIVPSVAVVSNKGVPSVRVVDSETDKSFTYRPVTTGVKSLTHTQILSGVSEGELVVVDEQQ